MADGERRRRLLPRRGSDRSRRRLVHLGLRARITTVFGLGALALSLLITSITYFMTSSSIVTQDEHSFELQAIANATSLETSVYARDPSILVANMVDLSDEFRSTTSYSLIYVTSLDLWYATYPLKFYKEDLPESLRALTLTGKAVEQTFIFRGMPYFGVGIAIPAGAYYFGVFSLDAANRTRHVLLASLIAAAAVTTLLGAALGRWAAGRTLRPLRDVSQAASSIASGMLDTRLETVDARDLAMLTSSFNRMADRLQQRIERDARFTSDVSHELRSPLTTLATSLSVIESRREELPERAQRALDLLGTEVRRFQRMVRDLLEISRFDARSADFAPTPVEIGDLVRHAVSPTDHVPVPVIISPEDDHRELVVDKRRIERVFGNLLENADRYAGGVAQVVVETSDHFVRVCVDDSGPGIPPADRDRIFERFARGPGTAGSRGAGSGTGLGLALVQEHVRLHGGRVWVTDAPTGGARFVVELPISQAAERSGSDTSGSSSDTGRRGDR
ncbi:MAG TPA: HAMP domain-containing sensor histidine kinase [Acidimicrobiales bacterium]|nr:HAMP domain-containing sensor histidine kinase [Acidimicrobiales bacterium]